MQLHTLDANYSNKTDELLMLYILHLKYDYSHVTYKIINGLKILKNT